MKVEGKGKVGGAGIRGKAARVKTPAVSGGGAVEAAEETKETFATKVREAELEELLREIEERGERLVERRTETELVAYRDAVKEFMARVVGEGWVIEEIPSARFMENNKVFLIAKTVKKRLLDLAEEIRREQSDAMTVTALTSEIRGLLLDLRG
ncbi:MAG: DUF327 family protein [Candidatus Hydrogenedentota bacterium]|nr:MAG: DUF327 family protein [Candidatus Hydrogenedentota bacterium]